MKYPFEKVKFGKKVNQELDESSAHRKILMFQATKTCAKALGLLKTVKTDRFTQDELNNYEKCLDLYYGGLERLGQNNLI